MKPINIFNVIALAFTCQKFFLPTPNLIKCKKLIVGKMPPNIQPRLHYSLKLRLKSNKSVWQLS